MFSVSVALLFISCARKKPVAPASVMTPHTATVHARAADPVTVTPVIVVKLPHPQPRTAIPPAMLEGLPPADLARIQAEAKRVFLRHWPTVSERSRYVRARVMKVIRRLKAPAEMQVLPIVESGYNPYAFSPAGAMGLWQLMPATARILGIRDRRGFNGRRHIEQSTEAAITYLLRMKKRFGSWPLALAAYHRGPGAMQRRLRRHPWRTSDGLARLPVPAVTRAYVRHVLGLVVLTRLGVIRFPPPIKTAPLNIRAPVDLQRLAGAAGISGPDLFRFNPGLDYSQYLHGQITLNIPVIRLPLAQQHLLEAAPRRIRIQVRSGDSLWGLARKYGTTVSRIRHLNPGIGTTLSIGQVLAVPAGNRQLRASTALNPLLSSGRRILYRVRRGDTLWDIAQRFGTSARAIARANSLHERVYLQPGDRLWIHARIRPS